MAVFKCGGRLRFDGDGNPYCTYESQVRWTGRCPWCLRYYDCDKVGADKKDKKHATAADAAAVEVVRVPTGIENFDLVLGGGLTEGVPILFGGPRGTGKTQLLLKAFENIVKRTRRLVVYANGEQSTNGVLEICKRVGVADERVAVLGNAKHVDDIFHFCDDKRPVAVAFDSIQSMSVSGSHAEEVAKAINEWCEKKKVAGIIVSHMGKDLDFKGSTSIPHYVDGEFAIYRYTPEDDGDPRAVFGKRLLREVELKDIRTLVNGKNRHGEEGVKTFFQMTSTGLVPLQRKPAIRLVGDEEDEDEV